jgi:hypothetical protein
MKNATVAKDHPATDGTQGKSDLRTGVRKGSMMLYGGVFHQRRHGCFVSGSGGFAWRQIFWYKIYRDRRM